MQIIQGDCIPVMSDMIARGVQVDSIVTDPPYGIRFMGMAWDGKDIDSCFDTKLKHQGTKNVSGNSDRITAGIVAGTYDRTPEAMIAFQEWTREWAMLAFQLLKPGGHLLCFASPRTYHRMASGIEDAGFQVRDQLMWVFGQGFPKSLDVSKAIDKAAGAEREVVGKTYCGLHHRGGANSFTDDNWKSENRAGDFVNVTAPATSQAKQWQGFGTALKPAHEPIVLARKPLSEKTVAANVLKHGTGAINIDGCRVGNEERSFRKSSYRDAASGEFSAQGKTNYFNGIAEVNGRFPANLIHDGSDEVEDEFAKYGNKPGCSSPSTACPQGNIFKGSRSQGSIYADTGTASRFFYCAKASKKDRNGSKHPTVKPIALMRYLCRLITPPGGLILDPFAGSGTTGQAAMKEGFKAMLIEKEEQYIQDIENRLHASG